MDIFDDQKRSEVMSRIRGKNTVPELRVRSFLHKTGLRYVLHDKRLPGRPDISFTSRRIAVFVHGCFWHGHEGCRKARLPATRREFWQKKIEGNKLRDDINVQALRSNDWTVYIVWQCLINDDNLAQLAGEIVNTPRREKKHAKFRSGG